MDELDHKIAAVIFAPKPPLDPAQVAALRAQFAALDKNHDGVVDKEELMELIANVGSQEDREYLTTLVMESCDKDGDGRTDFEEFLEAASMIAGSCEKEKEDDPVPVEQ